MAMVYPVRKNEDVRSSFMCTKTVGRFSVVVDRAFDDNDNRSLTHGDVRIVRNEDGEVLYETDIIPLSQALTLYRKCKRVQDILKLVGDNDDDEKYHYI